MNCSNILKATASAIALALVVYSCKGNLSEAEKLNLEQTPLQTVDEMFFLQSKNGKLQLRVEAPRMEVFEHDTVSYDLFPKGIHVYGYSEEGMLETTIVSREARHDKFSGGKEVWSAFGQVIVQNIVKKEKMETDTLYWDAEAKEIWTDCYVKMSSPDGLMQGYGMRSDEMARNAILLKPFHSEFILDKDTTRVSIDSVNFIGPLQKNNGI